MAQRSACITSEKEWVVVLEEYRRYWYDLVVNAHDVADYFDTKMLVIDALKEIK